METWQTIGVQMGIAGLISIIGYRIALVLINAWTTSEAARTKALAEAEKDRTAAITSGFKSVTDVHASLLSQQTNLALKIVALDSKISTIFDLTPVHGTTIPPGVREALTTPSAPLQDVDGEYDAIPEPKVIVSEASARKTPPGGVKVPRHKTVG